MQSINNFMYLVAKYISDNKNHPGNFFFSKIDLKYAYSQIPPHPEIRKHGNFNILGGKSAGTYQFINGFYGLSDMPSIFQKTLDRTLENIHNKFNFLDDILIIIKGSQSEHEADIDRGLSRIDKESLANMIWFPQIHRTIALRAEICRQCLDQGKNLKPII